MIKQATATASIHFNNHSRRSHRKKMVIKRWTASFLVLIFILTAYTICHKTAEPAEQFVYQPVVVQYGDTLWKLAESSDLHMDTRTLVLKIIAYNSLAGSTILPGQTIYIPGPAKIIAIN
ncbi:MAG TPA: LysM peptidoglycan-binding domain-containing protein [Desulfitobacteriaceae bacterium]|nr:LysM peptidoglycan-binding domain-containing protein [Desulfitobacteriaceae bacterium]